MVESTSEASALTALVSEATTLIDDVETKLANGEFNGEKGDKGDKGATGSTGPKGADGVSCTHSWNGTVLSVTSASGTSAADLKGAKGDKGDAGSDANVTTENIVAALNYVPANTSHNHKYIVADGGEKVFFGTKVTDSTPSASVGGAVTNDLYINISNWKVYQLMGTGIWANTKSL